MLTLDDFAKQILRPQLLRSIKGGAVDNALSDPDVIEILAEDAELAAAALQRIKLIAEGGSAEEKWPYGTKLRIRLPNGDDKVLELTSSLPV